MRIGRKIIENASWIIICRIAQSIISLIISMITARYLGPSNFGIIAYATAITTFILPVAQLGINNILVQEIVENSEEEGKFIGTSILMSTIASCCCIVGIWSFTTLVNAGEKDTIVVCVLFSISLLFQATELIQYWYQAKLISKFIAITSLISRFIVSIYKISIIVTGKSIYWFAIVNSLDYLLISAILIIIYIKKGNHQLTISITVAKRILTKSKHFIIAGMMVSVFGQIDRIMLKTMLGNKISGYYSLAITCATMTSFVFAAVIDSLRPVIFENKNKQSNSYENKVCILFSVIFYMALCQSVVFTIGAKPIVLLMYGSAYIPSIPILQIITWYSPFSYIGAARNVWILAENKQKYLWIINLSGAVLNVVGNLILIPICGACGAALASVLTQLFTNYILNYLIKPMRPCGRLMIKSLNPKITIDLIKNIKNTMKK